VAAPGCCWLPRHLAKPATDRASIRSVASTGDNRGLTKLHLFLPLTEGGVTPDFQVRRFRGGECWWGSITDQNRVDAWRCGVNRQSSTLALRISPSFA
jgi:hypothetical protein